MKTGGMFGRDGGKGAGGPHPGFPGLLPLFAVCMLSACSFDYGNTADDKDGRPDMRMTDLEYVRVRGGEPVVRIRAESAERYENKQIMKLDRFSFEYFTGGDTVSTSGWAGRASVELNTGDVRLNEGVRVFVESEDITIETDDLSWEDGEKRISGGTAVHISRSGGTRFSGRGFSADARSRTWVFEDGVEGSYVHTDEEAAEEPVSRDPADGPADSPAGNPADETGRPGGAGTAGETAVIP
jgi:LPS export ABC transporter protein LptC